MPFDRGYFGDELLSLMLYLLAKSENPFGLKGGPQSENISSGKPCDVVEFFKAAITLYPVLSFNLLAIMYLL